MLGKLAGLCRPEVIYEAMCATRRAWGVAQAWPDVLGRAGLGPQNTVPCRAWAGPPDCGLHAHLYGWVPSGLYPAALLSLAYSLHMEAR
jgi:hypothetical protein